MARPTRETQLTIPTDEICDDGVIHVDAVRLARSALIDAETLDQVSQFFAAMSDPNRVRILNALQPAELCVCDIAASVGLSESAVSHHLRHLRLSNLVRNRRDGRRVWYSLDDAHVTDVLRQAIEHASHGREVRP